MADLEIRTLGELTVLRAGEPVALPASRKTRALLAYLALTGRPQRRDRLCEVFWDVPDDPRAALRWSLSKLRGVVNDDVERLTADRERVLLSREATDIDLVSLSAGIDNADLDGAKLRDICRRLEEPLLAGTDLPDQPIFQRWLTAEREEVRRLLMSSLEKLATQAGADDADRLGAALAWFDHEPGVNAASVVYAAYQRLGRTREAQSFAQAAMDSLRSMGITWVPQQTAPPSSVRRIGPSEERRLLDRQRIQFCTAEDGVRIAYATVGEGPPLVKAANWLNHLELDWDAPIWSPLFRELAQDFRFVRYDERGNGLSDWDVGDISFDAFVADLETVTDAVGLKEFALLGISQGASVSIEYAARYPERVTHLVLFGGYPAGWRIGADEATTREREAVITLTETGWGRDDPAYRQIFSSTFMPTATSGELEWFNEFQRQTTSAENAARFLHAFGNIDVRERLAEISTPTLVIHSRGDRRIPLDTGRDLAADIPNAEFLSLDSENHLLLGREPASAAFVAAVRSFVLAR